MAQRTCDLTGCERKHLARGLCARHYNQALPEDKRHPRYVTPCVICKTPVTRRRDARYQPTCSVRCRTIVQWGKSCAHTPFDWANEVERRARSHRATIVESFDRLEIFERDGWICQICEVPCTPPDPYTLTAATVDHVIPFVRGGEHSRLNVQTCCLSCNSSKGADAPSETVCGPHLAA